MGFAGYISFLAAGQGLFLAVLLTSRKTGNRVPNRILALLLGSWSFVVFGTALGSTGLYRNLPHLIRVGQPMVLTLGPLFLMYTTALRRGRPPVIQLLHFVPFLLYLASLLPFYLASPQIKFEWVELALTTSSEQAKWNLAAVVHALIYTAVAHGTLRMHARQVEGFAPDLPETDLKWLGRIARGFVFVSVFALSGYTAAILQGSGAAVVNWLTGGIMALCLYMLGFWGLNAPQVFGDRDYPAWHARTPLHAMWGVYRFEPQRICEPDSNAREQQVLEQLRKYLDREKTYLNPDLSLRELADRTQIPRYLISRIVNRRLERSFADWISEYRVREVQRYLSDPANDSEPIIDLAFAAGFNSKTAFNTAFRRIAGQSPSAYRTGSRKKR